MANREQENKQAELSDAERSVSNLKTIQANLIQQWDKERLEMMVAIEKKGAERMQIAQQVHEELKAAEARLEELRKATEGSAEASGVN